MTEIKIPFVALGHKVEECIRAAIFTDEETGKLKLKTAILKSTEDLERNTFEFHTTLHKAVLAYYKKSTWCEYKPSTKEILKLFNKAYNIATRALNVESPLDRYNEYFEYTEEWIELDPETASEEGMSHCRNVEEINMIFSIVYCILEKEPQKSPMMELFLTELREDTMNDAIQDFISAMSPSRISEEADKNTDDNTTENHAQDIVKKREKAIKAIGKVIKESFGDNQKKFQPAQWSAIHEVYKKEVEDITAKDFVRLMTERGINKGSMASAISRGGRIILHLENDPRKWVELRETEKKESLRMQIDVALRLIELLDDPSI